MPEFIVSRPGRPLHLLGDCAPICGQFIWGRRSAVTGPDEANWQRLRNVDACHRCVRIHTEHSIALALVADLPRSK